MGKWLLNIQKKCLLCLMLLDPVKTDEEYLRNKAYFFIQPVPGYRNNFHVHQFMPKKLPLEIQQYLTDKMQLLDETADAQNSFSITSLLENYRLQPFVDNAHYTLAVCDLIAAFIAQKIQIP